MSQIFTPNEDATRRIQEAVRTVEGQSPSTVGRRRRPVAPGQSPIYALLTAPGEQEGEYEATQVRRDARNDRWSLVAPGGLQWGPPVADQQQHILRDGQQTTGLAPSGSGVRTVVRVYRLPASPTATEADPVQWWFETPVPARREPYQVLSVDPEGGLLFDFPRAF